jgi:alpha-amylase/alpha-mannosidase (GH57 family)
MTSLIIHGHFYQPPRENPWTGVVEAEPSAAPFHDWNERIHSECYQPNSFASINDSSTGGERIVNNYAHISFNFGPTLLSWLEANHQDTYERIIDADRESFAKRKGHGNAIAQAYGHAILPLCNERDRLTQVLWGLEDFRYRFGRQPESMWLPETACNDATLDLLIEQSMRFVILSPKQAGRMRKPGGDWTSVEDGSIDTSRAYRYFHRDKSRRSIAIFFYDGPLSQAIAFEKILNSSERLVEFFQRAAKNKTLVNTAIDGETYGHHFKFGDLCLAYALAVEAPRAGFRITNYGKFLGEHPAEAEVELQPGPDGEGTACSCAHGLGRWSRDCGCHTGGEEGWNQAWRTPLRAALEFLRNAAADQYECAGGELFHDPWAARNRYIHLLLNGRGRRSRGPFLQEQAGRALSSVDEERAMSLLEMQRNALLMFTSCGWFFNDLAGIETLQILRYAARVIQLLDELGLDSPRNRFLEILAEAHSNVSESGNGAEIYLQFAEQFANRYAPSVT